VDSEFWLRLLPPSVGAPCGWCGKDVEMPIVTEWRGVLYGVRDAPSGGKRGVIASLYVCPRYECRRPTLVFFDATYHSGGPLGPRSHAEQIAQLPRGTAQPMEDLPPEIEGDRLEAWSCFYGGDLRAAVIMGRAAVQRAVRKLEATGAGLKAEIRSLSDRGIITLELKKWADEVRIAGDDAAHPEELGAIEEAEAKESLEFMDEFLRHSVAMPERRRRREEARKAGGG
jgi:hypothetical protein